MSSDSSGVVDNGGRVIAGLAAVGSKVNRLDTLIERIDQEEMEASLTTAGTLVRMSLLDFLD